MSNQMCSGMQSPQQMLYNLYNTVALTEIKGYTMIQFSYMILRLYNEGTSNRPHSRLLLDTTSLVAFLYLPSNLKFHTGKNFNEEIETLKQQYAVRTSETLRAVKTAMAFAPRNIWKCDPLVHKSGKVPRQRRTETNTKQQAGRTWTCRLPRKWKTSRVKVTETDTLSICLDETYTELKQLFQGYIVNEVDLNSDGTCKENCAYYGYTKVYGCYKDQFCSRQRRCNGKILNCEYIDSDMWICPSVGVFWLRQIRTTPRNNPRKAQRPRRPCRKSWMRARSHAIILILTFYPLRTETVVGDTSTSSTRTVWCTAEKTRVPEARQKSTAGGDGCSGIAATASAIVTITTRAPTDTSVSETWYLISRIISK